MNGGDRSQRELCDIARNAFEVVGRLLSRDQLLARDLRSPTTGSRQIYREECITVEMASALRERFPDHVEITLFTPPEETRTGADWYWRFEKAGGAIHARVQAKRVQRTEFGQSDNLGHVDIDRPQLGQLLAATRVAQAQLPGLQAWLATYARFDATPPCGQEDMAHCNHHGHGGTCQLQEPSVWIAKAESFASGAPRIPIHRIVQDSVRLDCVLPCIDQQGGNGPEEKGFSLELIPKTFQECVAAIEAEATLRAGFEGALLIRTTKPARP